jgi:curved DNA-binding protein CbpA
MLPQAAEIENLAHDYRVLDVPWDPSPRAIKASYRKLVKRWHPDRYPPATESHAESTLMTRLLNDAFARIENAPLRNGTATPFSHPAAAATPPRNAPSAPNAGAEADPSGSSRNEYIPRDPQQDAADFYRIMERARVAGARDDAARPFDWFGFIVRFILGAFRRAHEFQSDGRPVDQRAGHKPRPPSPSHGRDNSVLRLRLGLRRRRVLALHPSLRNLVVAPLGLADPASRRRSCR